MRLQVDLLCPNCGRRYQEELASMRPGRTYGCAGCGCLIRYSGDDGRTAQQALDNLERTLRDLGRTFKLRR